MGLTPISLSDPMFDVLSEAIAKGYPDSCILWIDRVDNAVLRERYNTYKSILEETIGKDNVKELQLFHGSTQQAIQAIVHNGFDASMNRTSAYGIGTYFAVSAGYSKDYAKQTKNDGISYMILCDVCVGRICQGSNNISIDASRYDNFVNNTVNPTIYVAPHDNSTCPAYIIAFHKN